MKICKDFYFYLKNFWYMSLVQHFNLLLSVFFQCFVFDEKKNIFIKNWNTHFTLACTYVHSWTQVVPVPTRSENRQANHVLEIPNS